MRNKTLVKIWIGTEGKVRFKASRKLGYLTHRDLYERLEVFFRELKKKEDE